MVGDLKPTAGYILEIEGGSVFVTSYCLMFNFHPKLEMTPVMCLRSFGQNENELKHVSVLEFFFPVLIVTTIGVY